MRSLKKSERSFRRLQAHRVKRAAFPKSIPRPLVPTSRPSVGVDENVPSDCENVEGQETSNPGDCENVERKETSNPGDGANVEGKETSNPSDGANVETSETEERVAWLEARVTALEEMVANLRRSLGVDEDVESESDGNPYTI